MNFNPDGAALEFFLSVNIISTSGRNILIIDILTEVIYES